MHARLARFATTPGGFLAFTRTEYETDAREVARTIHVPAAVLTKPGPSLAGAAEGQQQWNPVEETSTARPSSPAPD